MNRSTNTRESRDSSFRVVMSSEILHPREGAKKRKPHKKESEKDKRIIYALEVKAYMDEAFREVSIALFSKLILILDIRAGKLGPYTR